MEEYVYSNIFDTKGIEYLVIIAFLALLIPFWLILNKQVKFSRQIQKVLGILSANSLKIPQGIFFNRNHTWTHLEKSGNAMVGLDDLLLHLTGEVKLTHLKTPGDDIKKGDLMAEIGHKGKQLRVYSPISGKIQKTNSFITENPEVLAEDPYNKGWIYKIKPTNWMADTSACYFAEDATKWSSEELLRFKDFLAESMKKTSPESSMLVLQDGGEIIDRPLSELPAEIWYDFQSSFLNPQA